MSAREPIGAGGCTQARRPSPPLQSIGSRRFAGWAGHLAGVLRPTLGRRIALCLGLGLPWVLPLNQAYASTTVYRCPQAGVYSDQPCPGGQAMPEPPQPSPRARTEAQQIAAREQALASLLRAERKAREREPVANIPAGIRVAPLQLSPSPPAQAAPGPRKPVAIKPAKPSRTQPGDGGSSGSSVRR